MPQNYTFGSPDPSMSSPPMASSTASSPATPGRTAPYLNRAPSEGSPVTNSGSSGGLKLMMSRLRGRRKTDSDSSPPPPWLISPPLTAQSSPVSSPPAPAPPATAVAGQALRKPLPVPVPDDGPEPASVGLGLGTSTRSMVTPATSTTSVAVGRAPIAYEVGSVGWRGARRPMSDDTRVPETTTPLIIRARATATAIAIAPGPDKASPTSTTTPGVPAEIPRHPSSADSLRQLMEAATELGLDPDKVNELVKLSYNHGGGADHEEDPGLVVVRRTIILPSADIEILAPLENDDASPGMRRSQTLRERSGATAAGNVGTHRRTASDAAASIASSAASLHATKSSTSSSVTGTHKRRTSGSSTSRRSVHDRPPTPPPSVAHRRRRSSDLLRAASSTEPVMIRNKRPPPIDVPAMPHLDSLASSTATATGTSSIPTTCASGTSSSASALLEPPSAALLPPPISPGQASFRSAGSSRSRSSYAASIFDIYGDPDEPTVVLARGRIPGPGEGPVLPVENAMPSTLPQATAGTRVEVDEMQDGSLVWQASWPFILAI